MSAALSSRDQCVGQRVAMPCTSWPRFRVAAGYRWVEWACGNHVTSSMLRAADAHGSEVKVTVLW